MFQLRNSTPFSANLMLLANQRGIDTLFTVVKATFIVDSVAGVADEQVPVTLADAHYGDPVRSSVKAPSDVSIGKPATDILIHGFAVASRETPTWQMDVSASVGSVSRRARVFGDRVWENGLGTAPAWVEPFVRMPLVWERAFGGSDLTEKGPVSVEHNPVGAGFRAPNGEKEIAGLPLPNVEDPISPITSWRDRPPPVGFGAVAPHWLPRRSYAGTYDEEWQQRRAPYLPTDFDARFCQVAPLGMVASGYLRGGEIVDIRGMTSNGTLRFVLPAVEIRVTYQSDHGAETPLVVLDTVIIEPDAGRVIVTWRCALVCDKKARTVRHVRVSTRGRL